MKKYWPALSYEKGKETFETVHMFTQIVGKIKLATLPWVNHSWHVTLLPTIKGFTTGLLPYQDFNFTIEFDFKDHQLILSTSKEEISKFSLLDLSVADFYNKLFCKLKDLNINITIHPIPAEIQNPIPFNEDTVHNTYDVKQIENFHTAVLRITDVFIKFRTVFKGKCSPIHFFWGGFDLALSFFSGRRAPQHPGGIPGMPNWVAREAYNREVSSCGFWTGNESFKQPAFYCYLYPEPEGYKTGKILPAEAYYNKDLGEYILTYEAVQKSEDSATTLLEFLTSTYNMGATLANWERNLLED